MGASGPTAEAPATCSETEVRMNPLFSRFIQVLQADAEMWEEAARRCDSLIPHLVGPDQQGHWEATAESYRAQAKVLRGLIELVKAEQ